MYLPNGLVSVSRMLWGLHLTPETLAEFLRQETVTLPFSPLPLHYVAIAHLLLEHAAEDIPDASRVRALLKDLRDARQSKILAGLGMINPAHLEMTNISSMEICELRPLFVTALSQLHALHGSSNDANTEDMPSQTSESVAPTLDDNDENISVRRA